jgi:hypothetical protein
MANRLTTEQKKQYHLKHLFGINLSDYNKMHTRQNGRCAICKKKETRRNHRSGKIRYLSVDHCHKTGRIRGLLCDKCNRMLGMFEDNTTIIAAMLKYLRKAERANKKTKMAM